MCSPQHHKKVGNKDSTATFKHFNHFRSSHRDGNFLKSKSSIRICLRISVVGEIANSDFNLVRKSRVHGKIGAISPSQSNKLRGTLERVKQKSSVPTEPSGHINLSKQTEHP